MEGEMGDYSPVIAAIAWRSLFEIVEDDLSGEGTLALLRIHLAGMRANSPPGSVFALDLSGLKVPQVTVWTVRQGDLVISAGALRRPAIDALRAR
jgi:hypothetical protein